MSPEQQVKQWVREEIELNNAPKTNIFSRAQDLIRGAAMDVERMGKGKKRSVPGHPNRFLSKKKRTSSTLQSKVFSIVLFAQPLDDEKDSYRADKGDEILSGYVKLFPEQTELEIRQSICKVFESKYQLIKEKDFEFVKRSRSIITKPTVHKDFEWGFEEIKSLAGQGKLCTRLLVDLSLLILPEIFDSNQRQLNSIFNKPRLEKVLVSNPVSTRPSQQTNVVSTSKSAHTIPALAVTVECPICDRKFPRSLIQQHAATCKEDVFTIDISDTDDSDELNRTLPQIDEVVEKIEASDVLQKIHENQITRGKCKFRIRREKPWEDFTEYLQKPWFKVVRGIHVTFLGGEGGVDMGGPKREFFSLCIKEICKTIVVDGKIKKSIMQLANKTYFAVGRLLALSLIQGGPSPSIFDDEMYKFMTSKELLSPSEIKVPVSFVKNNLVVKKLHAAKDDKEFANLLMEDNGFKMLSEIGYRGVPNKETLKSRDKMISAYYYKLMIEPLIPAVQQLADGLDVDGLLQNIRLHPQEFKKYFVIDNDNWNEDTFLALIIPEYSEKGSNLNIKEVNVFKNFTSYIEDLFHDNVSSAVKPSDVLQFISGCSTIPALGFGKSIKVLFKHNCCISCKCKPTVSICDLVLRIPVHINSSADMKETMNQAIQMNYGFGMVRTP